MIKYDRPIEAITHTDPAGKITPVRIKYRNKAIQVNKVLTVNEVRQSRTEVYYIFRCQSVIDEVLKTYELKFDVYKGTWTLYKM